MVRLAGHHRVHGPVGQRNLLGRTGDRGHARARFGQPGAHPVVRLHGGHLVAEAVQQPAQDPGAGAQVGDPQRAFTERPGDRLGRVPRTVPVVVAGDGSERAALMVGHRSRVGGLSPGGRSATVRRVRSRTLTFADAVRLLGGADEPSVRWLERLTGVAAAGATVATLGGLDLFALRDEVVRWGHAVVGGLRERLAGLHRFDRTQRLVAAHSVIVVVAFYEALDAVLADHPHVAAQLTAAEQVSLATGGAAQEAYIEVLQQLVDTPPPMPAPHRPFEAVVDALRKHYETVADRLVEFLFLLPRNSRRGPTMAVQSAARSAPELAVRRYTEAYRALAVQAPEFGVWAAMTDAQATRELVRESTVDLAGQLAELRAGRGDPRAEALDAVRSGLGRRYRARLERSILSTADAPAHLVLPTLRQGYVAPHGLVRLAGPADRPATESWWAGADRVPDVQGLLLAHLTGPDATAGPLVVLGQPGSGKSVLTRMLAADWERAKSSS